MSRIRSKNTNPELLIRRTLYRLGYRYRLHRSDLPGKPDIVFSRNKKAIFVHGCFWHLHKGCVDGRLPKTNVEYWRSKLARNIARDSRNQGKLRSLGWRVLTVWECDLNDLPHVTKVLKKFLGHPSVVPAD